jgi:hypothetical protein
MSNHMSLSDYVIIAFVAIIFITGAVVVYRFMKRKF